MPSDIEMQKRANYHDLGRDDWMSLDEYLQSGLSDKDLGKAGGGLASLPGYDTGGPVGSEYIPGQNVENIKSKIATRRVDDRTYRKILKESGFTKKATIADFHKGYASRSGQTIGSHSAFQNHLKSKGLNLFSNEPAMMQKVTAELNKVRKGLGLSKYVNVGPYSMKGLAENLASQSRGYIGTYAESGSAITKTEYWDDALKLQEKADKKFGTKKLKEKLRWIARGLKGKWPSVGIGTTMSLLTKYGFGKALGLGPYVLDVLTPTNIMGFKDQKEDEKGLEVTVPLPYTQEKAPTERFKGGGMTDIYDMTQPLKKYEHGGFHAEPVREKMEEKVWAGENRLRDIGGTVLDKLKKFRKYGWADEEDILTFGKEVLTIGERTYDPDDPKFRYFIKKYYQGEEESFIEGIENFRRATEAEGFRKGGIVSLNHLTRRL